MKFLSTSFNRDKAGLHVLYEPIAVLEYDGRLRKSGESGGHYTCDIKENTSNVWFRTNDDQEPVQIEVSEVSKNAYVVLFKKKL